MTQCVEIKVFGLSAEASARLGGATSAVLDLSADFSLRLSKDMEKLSRANKISTEGALGFEAEFTKTNNAIFSEFASPVTLDSETVFYRVGVTAQGHGLQFDRLIVTGRTDKWQLELRRSPDHWVELASQYTTNQVDFGEFTLNADYLLANWPQGKYAGAFPLVPMAAPGDETPTYWPLLDYGGWVDESVPFQGAENVAVKSVGYEDFRPLLSLPYLLKRGFCLFGWTIDGTIFDTDWVKSLWVYALRPDYYIGSEAGKIVGRNFTAFDLDTGEFTYFEELVKGSAPYIIPYGPNWLCGMTNPQGISIKYTFKLKGNFTNNTGAGFLASFIVQEIIFLSPSGFDTGQIYSTEYLDVAFANGQTRYVDFEQTITIGPFSSAYIRLANQPASGFTVEKGLYFEIAPASKCFMTGDVVTVSDAVSDKDTILDWTKTFIQLCDGRAETNLDTKVLTIHTNRRADVYGTVVPQFLKVEESAIDISELIVKGSINTRPVQPNLKRYTRLEFANSADAYITSLNLSSPAHSRTITNGENLPNEIDSIQNPVVEPTLEGQSERLATEKKTVGGVNVYRRSPVLPRLWDNIGGERSFDIGPRILFGFGLVSQINPNPKLSTTDKACYYLNNNPGAGDGTNDGLTEDFGYATQLRTLDIDPTPTIDGNVVFGSEQNDLFVNFWLGLTQAERDGTEIDLLMRIRMKDYVGYDFRSLFFFYYNGIPLRVQMTSIRDFQTCSDMPTPVTFFVEPSDTECCDLPCGCQFTTCDYYQDFGVYMRQATLDLLKIDSFIVDGIELLTAPVSLGFVNMVDVGGNPFCTNLIDALNSIAAPYFSFGISTRIHPTRGARFFSIKHLACVPFRILITLDGDECYLYTQAEQQTKYFTGGTWDDLGYAPDFYGEPIECSTVTEY